MPRSRMSCARSQVAHRFARIEPVQQRQQRRAHDQKCQLPNQPRQRVAWNFVEEIGASGREIEPGDLEKIIAAIVVEFTRAQGVYAFVPMLGSLLERLLEVIRAAGVGIRDDHALLVESRIVADAKNLSVM